MKLSHVVNPKEEDVRRNSTAGFTLIELLVVLAIIGLLASIATPQVLRYLDSSKVKAAEVQVQNIAASLDLFKLDTGSYPSMDQGLSALVNAPTAGAEGWNGPYLKGGDALTDPWGTPYQYEFPGSRGVFDIYSQGPDNGDEASLIGNW